MAGFTTYLAENDCLIQLFEQIVALPPHPLLLPLYNLPPLLSLLLLDPLVVFPFLPLTIGLVLLDRLGDPLMVFLNGNKIALLPAPIKIPFCASPSPFAPKTSAAPSTPFSASLGAPSPPQRV